MDANFCDKFFFIILLPMLVGYILGASCVMLVMNAVNFLNRKEGK